MTSPMISQTYEQWRHCITVEYGIALTRAFVDERQAALRESVREEGRRFAQPYGEAQLRRVQTWFDEARRNLEAKPAYE